MISTARSPILLILLPSRILVHALQEICGSRQQDQLGAVRLLLPRNLSLTLHSFRIDSWRDAMTEVGDMPILFPL